MNERDMIKKSQKDIAQFWSRLSSQSEVGGFGNTSEHSFQGPVYLSRFVGYLLFQHFVI